MKVQFFPLLLAGLSLLSSAQAMWPAPHKLSTGTTTLALDVSSFSINLLGEASADLHAAAKRTVSHIKNDKHQRLIVGRGASMAKEVEDAPRLQSVQVTVQAHGGGGHKRGQKVLGHARAHEDDGSIVAHVLKPVEEHDEGYTLTLPAGGHGAEIKANTSLGALRGLASLEQLFYALPGERGLRYTHEAPIHIEDKPAFPYRGFMLDTARNYMPMSDLKRQIDAMYLVKLNQFHWHITDAQSFPLVVPGMEYLSQNGAYAEDMVYTPKDIKQFVHYAAERGVNVNVEIDMPGHLYMGIPDQLISCPNKKAWGEFANEPPSGQLKLNSSDVDEFVHKLITAVAGLFPGPYYSTGGDEINLKCYNATNASDIDSSSLKPFLTKAQDAVAQAGKTPMVWEEMALNFPETGKSLKKNTIVEAWTTSTNVKAILETSPDLRLIHAPSDFFYLDCGLGGWLGNSTTGESWCTFVTWQKMYSFDPYNGTEGVTNGRERVLGGEAALWVEQTDPNNLDSVAWPRAASAAEVFWTGANGPDGAARDVNEALPRIHDVRYRLVERGVGAAPLQPLWCALRRGQCNAYTAGQA